MKTLIASTCCFLATSALAQTKSGNQGGYAWYVSGALNCMASAPRDAATQEACIVAAVEECRAKSGVYEACLEALQSGFDEAIARVEAAELTACQGQLDSACPVVLRG